jgi:hypothetical protein
MLLLCRRRKKSDGCVSNFPHYSAVHARHLDSQPQPLPSFACARQTLAKLGLVSRRIFLDAHGKMVANSSTAGESPITNGTGKRKSEEGTQPHTRAKRNRYISIAWFVFPTWMCDILQAHKFAVTSASAAKYIP